MSDSLSSPLQHLGIELHFEGVKDTSILNRPLFIHVLQALEMIVGDQPQHKPEALVISDLTPVLSSKTHRPILGIGYYFLQSDANYSPALLEFGLLHERGHSIYPAERMQQVHESRRQLAKASQQMFGYDIFTRDEDLIRHASPFFELLRQNRLSEALQYSSCNPMHMTYPRSDIPDELAYVTSIPVIERVADRFSDTPPLTSIQHLRDALLRYELCAADMELFCDRFALLNCSTPEAGEALLLQREAMYKAAMQQQYGNGYVISLDQAVHHHPATDARIRQAREIAQRRREGTIPRHGDALIIHSAVSENINTQWMKDMPPAI